jgi:pimeloyl-ACP methyl ester carboxylesterase
VPYADSGDARIHWEESGSGDPLLLIMGFGLSAEAWTPMLPMLAGMRTIYYDNRGTGSTEAPLDDLSIETFAGDAAAVLRAAGVDRAHVHGQSMGGMIAQQFALAHPDMVHTLALGATSPAPIRFFPQDPQAVVDLFSGVGMMATDPAAGMELVLPAVFSPDFLRDNPSMRDLFMQLASAGAPPAAAVEATVRAMGDMSTGRAWDVSDRLGEITAPTLVQHGSADRVVPVEAGRFLAEHVPGAEYQELEGAGHVYAMERPLEALPRLLGFWAAHPLGAAVQP